MGADMHELFKIFQLNLADAEKINAAPDEPHRHDFEELIIGIQGEMEHFVDFKATIIAAPFVSFVAKGKVSGSNACRIPRSDEEPSFLIRQQIFHFLLPKIHGN
jgi:hypothetical protein